MQKFELNLEDNIFQLYNDLKTKTYQHSDYTAFNICDPKPRRIHKACVRDRVLHHAVFRALYPIFDRSFVFDSYSCRNKKGTHKAVLRLEKFCRKASGNNHKTIFALKCDIKKFFDSINQNVLIKIIGQKVKDNNTFWLVGRILKSFEKSKREGLPLGNVTSQLFANIYLDKLDQFIKHKLKCKYYLRYCDDFIIVEEEKENLEKIIPHISDFLGRELKLTLHNDKIIIRKYKQGIDFLGYVILPNYRVLRTKTKNRILKKIAENPQNFQSIQSYLGVLKHCRGYKIKKQIFKLLSSAIFQ